MKKTVLLLLLIIIYINSIVANDLQLYQAGKKAFSVGLYSIALENMDSYLRSSDESKKVEALYLSGISAYYLNKYKDSLTYLNEIIKDYEKSVYTEKSFYWIGLNYYYLSEYDLATLWFTKNTKIESNYKDISFLFNALAYLQLNNKEEAIKNFNSLIKDKNANSRYKEEAIYRLGTLYLEENDLNLTINTLNKILLEYPESKFFKDTLTILSEAYYSLEEWDNAERTYLLLLDIEKNKNIYSRLATITNKQKRYNETKRYLETYINEFGSNKNIDFMLADIYLKLKENKKAIILYENISKNYNLTTEEKEENFYRIGSLYFNENNYNEAYEYFLKNKTKDSLYFSILSGIQSDKNVLSQIKTINENFKGDKLSLDSINRYINNLEKRGKKAELQELLSYITELYPENIEYALTYGEFLLNKNELDKSLKYLAKGYQKNSEYYSNVSYKIGWIYYHKSEFTRAISYFNNIKSTDEEYTKSLYSKSICYYKINDLRNGEAGFLELLNLKSEFDQEVAYYLGVISKDKQNYSESIKYFEISKEKGTLEIDSLDNIASSYYHLKQYQQSLEIYDQLWVSTKKSKYLFNSGNCYLYLEKYNEALATYKQLLNDQSSISSSSYYRAIEILFKLDRQDEAFLLTHEFYNKFPDSTLPGDLIIIEGDNKFFNGEIDSSIIIYKKVLEIFKNNDAWFKARFKLAKALYNKDEIINSSKYYVESIKEKDKYSSESVNQLRQIVSDQLNPDFNSYLKNELSKNKIELFKVVPIYIEFIKQDINSDTILQDIDNLITESRVRDEIDQLIYLKALSLYNQNLLKDSIDTISLLLKRKDVVIPTKIDSLMLQGQLLADTNNMEDAIDLYLKIYVNYPDFTEKSSLALYRGLILSKKISSAELTEKIINIIKSEFSETIWGKKALNEN